MDLFEKLRRQRLAYSFLCKLGFPLVDALYLQDPPLDVAGLLAYSFMKNRTPPKGSQLDLRFKSRPPTSLSDTVDALKAEHREGYWYRGQRQRRFITYTGSSQRIHQFAPDVLPIKVILDSLLPSYFRGFLQGDGSVNWGKFEVRPILDYMADAVRALIASNEVELNVLFVELLWSALVDATRWVMHDEFTVVLSRDVSAPGTNLDNYFLDLLSLAQHYEYGSIMIDVTKSIDIATWFATTDWASGKQSAPPGVSEGVIYRFDAAKFEAILARYFRSGRDTVARVNQVPRLVEIFGVFGIADISDRFFSVRRPKAQHGGSILGLENFIMHHFLAEENAVDVFPFEHATAGGYSGPVSLEIVCPPGDPGAAIFPPRAEHDKAPISIDEMDAFFARIGLPMDQREHLINMRRAQVI